jgi:hypothetical protein
VFCGAFTCWAGDAPNAYTPALPIRAVGVVPMLKLIGTCVVQTMDGEPLSACRARYLKLLEKGGARGRPESESPSQSPAPPQVR